MSEREAAVWESKARILALAGLLERETRKATIEELRPWLRHAQKCEIGGSCSCGLDAALAGVAA